MSRFVEAVRASWGDRVVYCEECAREGATTLMFRGGTCGTCEGRDYQRWWRTRELHRARLARIRNGGR